MKKYFKIGLFLLLPVCAMGQQSFPDSLRSIINSSKIDSVQYLTNMEMGYYYSENNRDSSLLYYENAYKIAVRNKKYLAEATALSMKGYQNSMIGQYSASLEFLLEAFTKIEDGRKEKNNWMFSPGFTSSPELDADVALSRNQGIYSALMRNTENVDQEIYYLKESIITAKKINYLWRIAVSELNLSGVYLKLNNLDSALSFAKEGLNLIRQTDDTKYESALLIVLGDIYLKKENKQLAKQYYFEGIQSALQNNASSHICWSNYALCKYYLNESNKDSSLYYAKQTLDAYLLAASPSHIFTIEAVYENLYESYKLRNQFDSAYKYLGLTKVAADSIYKNRIKSLAAFQNLGFAEQIRIRDVEKEKLAYQSMIRTYGLLAGISVFIFIAFLLYRNSRNRKKANTQLLKQKEEIEIQKKNVEGTLLELKATQSQLIQSEKMASLGELTAGIAHEIQNPLNFVNNFSEVSNELIDEMNEELNKAHIEEAKIISNDIKQNLEKINHHGKRADAIVKGMLQHSQTSKGQKEQTDINALCDEYLRLAYHGQRAKDKSFNANLKTDYDNSIHTIQIIPQEIGRVVLNLLNNAFFTVNEKKQQQPDGYEPTVSISTKKRDGNVLITVSDNGNGIPKHIADKIFQPFFTTKPTGQGTGLGLSLAYDIVTKGHGGELKVDSVPNQGSTFIISIPS